MNTFTQNIKLFIVRHGESESNADGVFQGMKGKLTELGKKQAEFVAQRFLNIPMDVIVTSTAQRARETAEIINRALQKPIQCTDLCVERRGPTENQGKSRDDHNVRATLKAIKDNYHIPGWRYADEENFEDLKIRTERTIEYLHNIKRENVLMITHGMFVRMLVARMVFGENLDPKTFLRFAMHVSTRNTGITLCEYREWGGGELPEGWAWRLMAWNDYAHLG